MAINADLILRQARHIQRLELDPGRAQELAEETRPITASHPVPDYRAALQGSIKSEARLLRVGHAYQQATDWHERAPPA